MNSLMETENSALTEVIREERMFELAQRKAKVYSQSSLVPKEYVENIGNVLIAQNMANRMGADVLMVMQNLYIVHGRPGWSAQFLIATFNSCGRFSAIRYKFSGTQGKDDWSCVAYTTESRTGEVIEGSKISIEMAKAEGWHGKNGSKWRTIPEQMLRYRAATFLIRSTAPEIGMGLLTREELQDMDDDSVITSHASVDAITKKLESAAVPLIETKPADEPEPVPAKPAKATGKAQEAKTNSFDYASMFANCKSEDSLDGTNRDHIADDPSLKTDEKYIAAREAKRAELKK